MTDNIRTRVSIIACSLALGGVALAGAPSAGTVKFTTADVDVSSSLTKVEFTTTLDAGIPAKKVNKEFKKADRDRNAAISLNEYLIYIGEVVPPTKEELSFTEADTVIDGSLSLAEFTATIPGKSPLSDVFVRFLKADADVSSSLSLAEWTLYKKGKAKGTPGVKYLKFDLADRDGNDVVTLDEFATVFPRGTAVAKLTAKLAKLDDNDDGSLTPDEWNPGAPKAPL